MPDTPPPKKKLSSKTRSGIAWAGSGLFGASAGYLTFPKQIGLGGADTPSLWNVDYWQMIGVVGLVLLSRFSIFILGLIASHWSHIEDNGNFQRENVRFFKDAARSLGRWVREGILSVDHYILHLWKRGKNWGKNWSKNSKLKKRFLGEQQFKFQHIHIRPDDVSEYDANQILLTNAFTEVWTSIFAPEAHQSIPIPASHTPSTIWHHIQRMRSNRGKGLLIFGPLGSGKSTLLRSVMLKFIHGRNLSHGLMPRLPVYVELKQLNLPRDQSCQALPEVLAKAVRKTLGTSAFTESHLAEMLRTELSHSRCILLLDGLDEIPDVRERKKTACGWPAKSIARSGGVIDSSLAPLQVRSI